MQYSQFFSQLADALLPLVLALVSWCAWQASQWIRKRMAVDRRHDHFSTASVALDLAGRAVEDVVSAGGEAFARELRAAAEDGVVTPDELKAIKDKALAAARAQAGASVIAALKMVHKDPDAWLWTKIQSEAYFRAGPRYEVAQSVVVDSAAVAKVVAQTVTPAP